MDRQDGMIRDTPVNSKDSERLFDNAYTYCHEWCITDQAESLLAGGSSRSFDDINKCRATRPGSTSPVNINADRIAASLKTICGRNPECIIDGTVGGEDAAQAYLAAEAEILELLASKASLSVSPAALVADELAVVRVTINVTGVTLPLNFNGFAVSRTAANSIKKIPDQFDLNISANVGAHLRTQVDSEEPTNLYSSFIPLRRMADGTTSGLVAFPIINDMVMERNPTPLKFTAWNSLRTYNNPLLATTGERTKTGELFATSWEAIQIVIVFSYPNNQPTTKNLRSSVKFIADFVIATSTNTRGVCTLDATAITKPQNYLAGGFPGTEQTYFVNTGDALHNDEWSDSVEIQLGAYWVPPRRSTTAERLGPILISAYARHHGTEAIIRDSRISFAIHPEINDAQCPRETSSARIRVSVTDRKRIGVLERVAF